jgi:TatA/E family protein of Tat protein translocase
MPTVLLIFEFLGTTELLVIAVVALIIFGPRKLPEIGRSVGKSIAEFKRASDDFKRTWEYEVELENRKPALDVPQTAAPREPSIADAAGLPAAGVSAEEFAARAPEHSIGGETIARSTSYPWTDETAAAAETNARGVGEEEDELNAS